MNIMLVTTYYKSNTHNRYKNNKKEQVTTRQKIYILECDNCGCEFEKTSKRFKHTQMHCCSNCNHYVIAQQSSVKQKRINKYVDQFDASSGRAIGTFLLK